MIDYLLLLRLEKRSENSKNNYPPVICDYQVSGTPVIGNYPVSGTPANYDYPVSGTPANYKYPVSGTPVICLQKINFVYVDPEQ